MSYALVLLCGGLSTRMGTNKAFLPFGEYTLMEYQVRRFRPYFEKIYLSVPKMTDSWMHLAARLDCTAIPDCVEKIGPLGGLYSCLSAVTEEMLFFHTDRCTIYKHKCCPYNMPDTGAGH